LDIEQAFQAKYAKVSNYIIFENTNSINTKFKSALGRPSLLFNDRSIMNYMSW